MKFSPLLFGLATFTIGASAFAQAATPTPLPPAAPPVYPANATNLDSEHVAQDPDRPYRHGFTLELGLGIAMTSAASSLDADPGGQKIGLAPLSLGIGGFFNQDLALMFRAAGTSYFADTGGGHSTQVQNAFYGPVLQYWANDNIFVRGGVGLGVYGTNPLIKSNVTFRDTGFAGDLGVGFSFFNVKHHSLRVAFDLFPAYYGSGQTMRSGDVVLAQDSSSGPSGASNGGMVLSGAINFEWQYF